MTGCPGRGYSVVPYGHNLCILASRKAAGMCVSVCVCGEGGGRLKREIGKAGGGGGGAEIRTVEHGTVIVPARNSGIVAAGAGWGGSGWRQP